MSISDMRMEMIRKVKWIDIYLSDDAPPRSFQKLYDTLDICYLLFAFDVLDREDYPRSLIVDIITTYLLVQPILAHFIFAECFELISIDEIKNIDPFDSSCDDQIDLFRKYLCEVNGVT